MPRYYILTDAGEFQRLEFPGELKGTPVNLGMAIADILGKRVPAFVPGLAQRDGNWVNLCAVNQNVYLSTRLRTLRIKANYQSKEDLLIPSWGDAGAKQLSLDWTPPTDLHLRFAIEWSLKHARITNVFLFIFDDRDHSKTYKIPLPNVFVDGHVCLPDDFAFKTGGDMMTGLEYSIAAINASGWNNHLIRENGEVNQSLKMFQFKAVKDGFETVPPAGDWRKLCNTMGNASVAYMKP